MRLGRAYGFLVLLWLAPAIAEWPALIDATELGKRWQVETRYDGDILIWELTAREAFSAPDLAYYAQLYGANGEPFSRPRLIVEGFRGTAAAGQRARIRLYQDKYTVGKAARLVVESEGDGADACAELTPDVEGVPVDDTVLGQYFRIVKRGYCQPKRRYYWVLEPLRPLNNLPVFVGDSLDADRATLGRHGELAGIRHQMIPGDKVQPELWILPRLLPGTRTIIIRPVDGATGSLPRPALEPGPQPGPLPELGAQPGPMPEPGPQPGPVAQPGPTPEPGCGYCNQTPPVLTLPGLPIECAALWRTFRIMGFCYDFQTQSVTLRLEAVTVPTAQYAAQTYDLAGRLVADTPLKFDVDLPGLLAGGRANAVISLPPPDAAPDVWKMVIVETAW